MIIAFYRLLNRKWYGSKSFEGKQPEEILEMLADLKKRSYGKDVRIYSFNDDAPDGIQHYKALIQDHKAFIKDFNDDLYYDEIKWGCIEIDMPVKQALAVIDKVMYEGVKECEH